MARRTQTYAIRLAVEGGGQVKAELVSVGQSGEQSLKRIETAGDRASGGLKGVGRQAELLHTDTVKLYLDDIQQASGWSVDTTTGLVTFSTAPALGVEVTADSEFDVPVRFDTDHMAVTIETYRLHAWQQIPIVELRD
jgi:hypothetical protein